MITGTSAVVPDWCYLIPYCSELRDIDVTSNDWDPRINLPISSNTTDCFFLTNVSQSFRDLYNINCSEHKVPSVFRGEDIVCAKQSNTSQSQPPQNYKNKYTKAKWLRLRKQEHRNDFLGYKQHFLHKQVGRYPDL